MISLFLDNLLPVFLAAGAGWLLSAAFDIEASSVSRLAFYVFAPCLIFNIITDNRVAPAAMLQMVGFTLASLLALAALAFLLARALGWSRTMGTALVLLALLPNAGNFGLSANLFAFGEAGLSHASLFFVTSALLTFTLGVFVASLGRWSVSQALRSLLRIPTLWAVLLAAAVRGADARMPLPVERTVELLADACIPCFLVILGLQLHGRGVRARPSAVAVAVGLRLAGGAATGLLLAAWLGMEGAARQAGVLQAAMPSAVVNIVLATEYDVEPAFVTSAVFVSTLLSPLTLTPLMLLLGA